MDDKIFLKMTEDKSSENLLKKWGDFGFLTHFDDKERQVTVAKNMDKTAEYLIDFEPNIWCFPFIGKLMLIKPNINDINIEKMVISLTKAYTKKLNGDFVNTKDEIPEMIVYAVEDYLKN